VTTEVYSPEAIRRLTSTESLILAMLYAADSMAEAHEHGQYEQEASLAVAIEQIKYDIESRVYLLEGVDCGQHWQL